MSVAAPTAESLDAVGNPSPHLYEVTAPPASVDDEMRASIARTAFMGYADRIRVIDKATLNQGNAQVHAAFGDDARRLLIVGPDAIKFPGEAADVVEGSHVAELLGLFIIERRLVPSRRYLELGFFPDSDSDESKLVTMSKARQRLSDIVDSHGQPLPRQKRQKGNYVSGIEDILIVDIRHTVPYKQALREYTNALWQEHVLNGGPQPELLEPGVFDGARRALQLIDIDALTATQQARFRTLSQKIAALLNPEITEPVPVHPARLRDRDERRAWIKDAFNPTWHDDAACNLPGVLNAFYKPPRSEKKLDRQAREARAKKICATCKAQPACLKYALSTRELEGIWGGLTEAERQAITSQ